MIRINQCKLPIPYDEGDLIKAAAGKLRIKPEEILSLKPARRSIDARKKPDLFYVMTLDVCLKDPSREKAVVSKCRDKDISIHEYPKVSIPSCRQTGQRIIVVGSGPCGYFCAYYLLQNGYHVTVLEQGADVDTRSRQVDDFINGGKLRPDSNVQFGEGGAGTFSDGKLNTLIKDKYGYMRCVLQDYVSFGASEEILYDAKAHIGTDVLKTVIKNMRKKLISLGGEILFETKMTDIEAEGSAVRAVITSCGDRLPCDRLVLAIGHSSRDTYEMLNRRNVLMEPKNFAVGFRVQHPQEMINRSQYGDISEELLKILGAAPYKVTNQTQKMGVYSFCMCPGGYVINSSSEEQRLVINGMSYHDRAGRNANAAIIMTIDRSVFEKEGILGGIAYQRRLEEEAFRLGDGRIPCQYLKDFKQNVPSTEDPGQLPEIKGNYVFTNLRGFFPKENEENFLSSMEAFARAVHGFDDDYTILSVVESRTSSPVRILRNDETFESSISGLFPAGEGAGYAGGITSAAVDGIKAALHVALSLQ